MHAEAERKINGEKFPRALDLCLDLGDASGATKKDHLNHNLPVPSLNLNPKVLNASSSLSLLNSLFLVGGAVAIVAGIAALFAFEMIALGSVLMGLGLVSLSMGLSLFFSRPDEPERPDPQSNPDSEASTPRIRL